LNHSDEDDEGEKKIATIPDEQTKTKTTRKLIQVHLNDIATKNEDEGQSDDEQQATKRSEKGHKLIANGKDCLFFANSSAA
jgi:hypothetical protein